MPLPHLDANAFRPDDPAVVNEIDDVVDMRDTADGVTRHDRASAHDREAVPNVESKRRVRIFLGRFVRLVHARSLADAERLGVTERHVRRLVAERRIPYVKVAASCASIRSISLSGSARLACRRVR
jgi:hypothetical protein